MSNNPKRPLAEVAEVAESLREKVAPHCHRIEIAGSIRRQKPLVGDIELVALPIWPKNLLGEVLEAGPSVLDSFFQSVGLKLGRNGPKYNNFVYGAFKVDLYTPPVNFWGVRLVLSTGSREFNIWMVDKAMRSRGFRMSDGKVWDNGGCVRRVPEEQDLFNLLEMPFIPPEDRDDGRWHKHLNIDPVISQDVI